MLQVRGKIYRGIDGFAICGRKKGDKGGWPISIFVKHLSTALAIKEVLNNDRYSHEEKQRLTDRLILEERR